MGTERSETARRGAGYAPAWKAADAAAAALLWGWFAYVTFRGVFHRPEWTDWIAYALPAANLVERGALSLPQLGPQYGFDRFWDFNSPLVGLGPAGFFAVLGTGRVALLVGVLLSLVVNSVVYPIALKSLLGLKSYSLAVLCSYAFLGHFAYTLYYAGPRMDGLAFSALLLIFFPAYRAGAGAGTGTGRGPSWRWLGAGGLPLIHPVLILASPVWAVARAWEVGVSRSRGEAALRREIWVGPLLFALASAGAVAWYGRPGPFSRQFLPHLTYDRGSAVAINSPPAPVSLGPAFRRVADTTGRLVTLAVVVRAVCLVASRLVARSGRGSRATLPACLIVLVLALRILVNFKYYNMYTLGLGPCLLHGLTTPVRRRMAVGVVAAVAVVHVALTPGYCASWTPDLTGQGDAVAFIARHTAQGDRIVTGPPFVLAAAPRRLEGGREVVRVVPQPYYLDGFDVRKFREDVRANADVYIGEPYWFEWAAATARSQSEPVPLLVGARVRAFDYRGTRVIVARRRPDLFRPARP